jgi:hypothetical protein
MGQLVSSLSEGTRRTNNVVLGHGQMDKLVRKTLPKAALLHHQSTFAAW